jgi:hypothetical protein
MRVLQSLAGKQKPLQRPTKLRGMMLKKTKMKAMVSHPTPTPNNQRTLALANMPQQPNPASVL